MNIKPPRLKPGDEIGLIAPAGPVTPNELSPGIDLLTSMGYGVRLSTHLYHRKEYLAGEDDARLQDLHSMFKNDKIKAIFCARGGYGSIRLLGKINYHLIRENPKVILGYSDITALLLAVLNESGIVTFHGPVVRELSHDMDLDPFFQPIISQGPLVVDLSCGSTLIPGGTKGILLGGNLSLMCHLIGTSYMPLLNGCILFVEERGEPLYKIDRMLTYLNLSGLFKNVSGLILGQFENCGDISTIHGLFTDIGKGLDIPVCSGLPVGHGKKNITLPLGVQASLDTVKMNLTILEPCISD